MPGTKRRGMIILAVCAASAALSLVALGATLVYRVHSSNEFKRQTSEQCHAIETLKGAIRLVFEDNLSNLELRRKTLDPAQYRIAHDYYERQLDRFRATECP